MPSFLRMLLVLLVLVLTLTFSCSPLQKARIRQEVTIDTHLAARADLSRTPTLIVLTLAKEEKTLSKTTLSANEATADILSLQLLNRGFRIVDRAVINDYMEEQGLDLHAATLPEILEMGRVLRADFLILTNLFENLQDSHAITFLPGEVFTSIDTSANIGVSSRMIDLTTGEVIWVGIGTTQDQNFQKAIQRIARKLIASLGNRNGKP